MPWWPRIGNTRTITTPTTAAVVLSSSIPVWRTRQRARQPPQEFPEPLPDKYEKPARTKNGAGDNGANQPTNKKWHTFLPFVTDVGDNPGSMYVSRGCRNCGTLYHSPL